MYFEACADIDWFEIEQCTILDDANNYKLIIIIRENHRGLALHFIYLPYSFLSIWNTSMFFPSFLQMETVFVIFCLFSQNEETILKKDLLLKTRVSTHGEERHKRN